MCYIRNGSYARGEAEAQSDLDFLVFGGDGFSLTEILSLGEELREVLQKKVDIFEIREVNRIAISIIRS